MLLRVATVSWLRPAQLTAAAGCLFVDRSSTYGGIMLLLLVLNTSTGADVAVCAC
jgi:hypothetical protein